jgi:hypothetical protein
MANGPRSFGARLTTWSWNDPEGALERSDDRTSLREPLATTRRMTALFNEIGRIRVLFNFVYDEQLIDRPMRFRANFKRPSRKVLRKDQQKRVQDFSCSGERRVRAYHGSPNRTRGPA